MTIHSLVVSGAARIQNYCLLMLFTGFVLSCASLLHAQVASTAVSGVPRLGNFSGNVIDTPSKRCPASRELLSQSTTINLAAPPPPATLLPSVLSLSPARKCAQRDSDIQGSETVRGALTGRSWKVWASLTTAERMSAPRSSKPQDRSPKISKMEGPFKEGPL
jgi:hypothetical protein